MGFNALPGLITWLCIYSLRFPPTDFLLAIAGFASQFAGYVSPSQHACTFGSETQTRLRSTDAGRLVHSNGVCRSLGIAIGQNLLIRRLYTAVPEYTDAVTPAQVVLAGATGLKALANGSSDVLIALRQAYADSLRQVLILSLAAICVAFPASCAMERLNIKTVTEQRKRTEQGQELDEEERTKGMELTSTSTGGRRPE